MSLHTLIYPIHLSHLRHNNLRFASFIITQKIPPPPSMIFDSNYRQLYHWWCPNHKEWKIIFTKKLNWKKRRKLENKQLFSDFFLSFLLPVLIPAARIVTRGYAPLGVTAACVFPAPFRAQYLLEYCFSWMRSWVRAFRFLNESFTESKKILLLLCCSFPEMMRHEWVRIYVKTKPVLELGSCKTKNTRTRIPPRGVATTFFYRKKNPTYTNNENLISSYRISFCKPPSFS